MAFPNSKATSDAVNPDTFLTILTIKLQILEEDHTPDSSLIRTDFSVFYPPMALVSIWTPLEDQRNRMMR
jgi:hypothetical protein